MSERVKVSMIVFSALVTVTVGTLLALLTPGPWVGIAFLLGALFAWLLAKAEALP